MLQNLVKIGHFLKRQYVFKNFAKVEKQKKQKQKQKFIPYFFLLPSKRS